MAKYTLETLKELNPIYDSQHRVEMSDVEKVNELVQKIEEGINQKVVHIGDRIRYTNRYGDFYKQAHVEKFENDTLYICEQPYVPFVTFSFSGKRLLMDTSGGAWTHIPKNLEYVGREEKPFKVFGHCGACGNGALTFYAEVNVWRYTEGNPAYTTETHDKFYVSYHEKPDQDGYRYIVTQKGGCHSVFRTKVEYQAWLKTYHGVETEGSQENGRIVWTHKQVSKCIPLEEYLRLEGTVIDSELENARVQECKRIYGNGIVTTYLPYQRDRIELEKGTKRYMRAYEGV